MVQIPAGQGTVQICNPVLKSVVATTKRLLPPNRANTQGRKRLKAFSLWGREKQRSKMISRRVSYCVLTSKKVNHFVLTSKKVGHFVLSSKKVGHFVLSSKKIIVTLSLPIKRLVTLSSPGNGLVTLSLSVKRLVTLSSPNHGETFTPHIPPQPSPCNCHPSPPSLARSGPCPRHGRINTISRNRSGRSDSLTVAGRERAAAH